MGNMANAIGQIDTRVEIVTPENIAFQYRVAGPFRRLPAFLIDTAIRVLVATLGMIAAMIVFGSAGVMSVGLGIGLLLWFALAWFYGGLFEAFWNGQTPGKRLMGIRVVSVEGQPITPFQAILRNILRDVDAQPTFLLPIAGPLGIPVFLYQIGLVTATLNDRFQRLGDLASGTMVVIDQRQRLQGVMPSREPEAIRIGTLIPPNFQPSRSLMRALAAYVQRRPFFPHGRRLEIARHVGESLRRELQLPTDVDLDMLLCGLYRRAFLVERDDRRDVPSQGCSPFAEPLGATKQLAEVAVVDELVQTSE
jgi:uncharacterized RDD family membrane protein YckC